MVAVLAVGFHLVVAHNHRVVVAFVVLDRLLDTGYKLNIQRNKFLVDLMLSLTVKVKAANIWWGWNSRRGGCRCDCDGLPHISNCSQQLHETIIVNLAINTSNLSHA